MAPKSYGPPRPTGSKINKVNLDRVVARSRRIRERHERSYREQSLKIHPWVCARCGREFTVDNLHMLTVHHRDHNHKNNPTDGSNWENLCLYCHDNEHSRYLDYVAGGGAEVDDDQEEKLSHNPFADLKDLLKDKK